MSDVQYSVQSVSEVSDLSMWITPGHIPKVWHTHPRWKWLPAMPWSCPIICWWFACSSLQVKFAHGHAGLPPCL